MPTRFAISTLGVLAFSEVFSEFFCLSHLSILLYPLFCELIFAIRACQDFRRNINPCQLFAFCEMLIELLIKLNNVRE